ncbi:MAG: hypothetical protein ABR571_02250 [Jatrophihabitans sp.]|uniref:hypothetical protein n=1 Tax=Jatrophihabitans sp. TaxID=1932789 RepID=UPI0039143F27
MRTRLLTGGAGVLLGLFGVFRLVTQIPSDDLIALFVWLLAALLIHDGLVSPVVVAVGVLVTKAVSPRTRRYLQGALVTGALITVIAVPLITRENSQPQVKSILQQDYSANLVVLLGIVAGGALALYVLRVFRDRSRTSVTNDRPSDDHPSSPA